MKTLTSKTLLEQKYRSIASFLDERSRRVWAATEAQAIGRGGISLLHMVTGLSRPTIYRGLREIESSESVETSGISLSRIRKPGGGRKSIIHEYPDLCEALESLVEPVRGDPMSPLRWTCKSTRRLAKELQKSGYQIGPSRVCSLLKELEYSLQSNRKTREGINHPDRNAQFEYIYKTIEKFHRSGQPVISVDTKKKEILGNFSNNGREYHPKGEGPKTNTHDFPDKELGKAVPYGVYDIGSNEGWVSVGINHDTSQFAVNSILRWWEAMGQNRFPRATRLYITADAGGSNGWRTRLWKVSLQELAYKVGLNITVSHFPPGTSKWNKVEHRLFSFITQNWRGRPLVDLETVVQLISSTTTEAGLIVQSEVDENYYEKGIKVNDAELRQVNIQKHEFHGEWNYTIRRSRKHRV